MMPTHRLLRFAYLAILATSPHASPSFVAATECRQVAIGNALSEANVTSGALHSGIGQTFFAADTLLSSLTVWRVASQDSNWLIGMHPYILATDSTGAPAIDKVIVEAPT